MRRAIQNKKYFDNQMKLISCNKKSQLFNIILIESN